MSKKKKYPAKHPNDIDLHGVKHSLVEVMVEDHVLMNPTPFQIITGNSATMKSICKKVLDRHGYKYADSILNLGIIEVLS